MPLSPAQQKFLLQLAMLGISQVVFYFAFKQIMKQMDPNADRKRAASEMVSCLHHHHHVRHLSVHAQCMHSVKCDLMSVHTQCDV